MYSISPLFMLLLLFHACDAIKINGEPRIVNGIPTTWEEYPFIAVIKEYEWDEELQLTDFSSAICASTLIRKEYPAAFITAAHCVDEREDKVTLQIRATLQDEEPIYGVTGWPILHYIIHPEYDPEDDHVNDIAIILAEADLTALGNLSAAIVSSDVDCCEEGTVLRAIGYGYVEDHGERSETIEYTDLKFITNAECDARLCEYDNDGENSECGDWTPTEDINMCALGESTTPCNGDSGGPLMKAGTLELVGAVSWGLDCNENTPTVFTKVAAYYDWIEENLAKYVGEGLEWPPLYPWQEDTPSEEEEDSGDALSAQEAEGIAEDAQNLKELGVVPIAVIAGCVTLCVVLLCLWMLTKYLKCCKKAGYDSVPSGNKDAKATKVADEEDDEEDEEEAGDEEEEMQVTTK